jgi:hypothetical protein
MVSLLSALFAGHAITNSWAGHIAQAVVVYEGLLGAMRCRRWLALVLIGDKGDAGPRTSFMVSRPRTRKMAKS